ncbi:MAG: trypsin-like peptidase domain-containing protein [Dermatophilaceae bacterium]
MRTAGTAVLASAVACGITLGVTGALGDQSQTTLQGANAANAASSGQAPGAQGSGAAQTSALADAPAGSWAAVAAKASPSVVAITVSAGSQGDEGSGVIWDTRADIVTNNHVVSTLGQGSTITVQLGAQTTYQATVVGTDPTTDLAVIRLVNPPAQLTPITRGTSSSVHVGDPVMALGNPLGLSGTVTTGIVSAVNRPMATQAVPTTGAFSRTTMSSQDVVTDSIQTSAAINPGNSGGALVNSSGALVGINSANASLGDAPAQSQGQSGSIGIGFAIPVNEVSNVVTQLIQTGTVQHAALGVSSADATVPLGSAQVSGAQVRSIQAGGPAASSGLQVGDVITAVNDQPVASAEGLVGQIRALSVGQAATLTVVRGGRSLSIPVTVGAQPAA